jgi:hypothetical protein
MAVDYAAYQAEMLTKMALVNASISTVGRLDGTSPVVLATVYKAVQNALAPFNAAIAAFDADIDQDSVGGVVAGLPGPTLAAALLNQAFDVSQEAVTVTARAYVSRVGVNIANATG